MRELLVVCLVLAAVALVPGASAADHKITFQNHCTYPVWVNSIIGPFSKFPAASPNPTGICAPCQCSVDFCCPSSVCPEVKCNGTSSCTSGEALPDGGGFKLESGSTGTHSLTVKKGWGAAFWGRTGCSDDHNDLQCETAGALSNQDNKDKLQAGGISSKFPATKGEITFDGYGDQDFYDMSIVDGYNLPIQIELKPGTYKKVGRPDFQYDCAAAGGGADLNAVVNAEAALLANKTQDGRTIGVFSACKYSFVATGSENKEYCCIPPYGQFKDRDNNGGLYCDPTTWPDNLNSATLFKKYYKLAYSYADDDKASTFTCKNAGPDTLTEYIVTFCSGNEGDRIYLPGSDDHTHMPVIGPVVTPSQTPEPVQAPEPEQTPVQRYIPGSSGQNF
ncbi:MAG: hypothetical protein OS112_04120 [Methanoregula sp.]|nr:MAG: hypothetical protein OS112_04120 [Methanoregula sp.]